MSDPVRRPWYESELFPDHVRSEFSEGLPDNFYALWARALGTKGLVYETVGFPNYDWRSGSRSRSWRGGIAPETVLEHLGKTGLQLRLFARWDGLLGYVEDCGPDPRTFVFLGSESNPGVKVFSILPGVVEKVRASLEPLTEPVVSRPVSSFYLLARTNSGYQLQTIGEERSEFLPDNYSPEVEADFRYLLDELTKPEPAGRLILIEGEPGTGKTRLVRALVAALQGGSMPVLIPSHLIENLSGPELVPTLLGHSRPVLLVLEDADFALVSRRNLNVPVPGGEPETVSDRAHVGALSSLLNLSDGIIGSKLNLRILATTNARIDSVDPAILRPGRLLKRTSVGPLPVDRARKVVAREAKVPLESVELPPTPDGTMTLAAAYAFARSVRR